MSTHTFSAALFSRIQKHAVPLVDSIEDVISRAFDHLEAATGKPDAKPNAAVKESETVKNFDAEAVPDLTHTTLLSMSINHNSVPKGISWNKLMELSIKFAGDAGLSSSEIIKIMEVPAVVGKSDNYSYTYIPEADVSVQGQNSNRAWRQTVRIANSVGFHIEASWVWQHKAKAYMPGVTACSSVN